MSGGYYRIDLDQLLEHIQGCEAFDQKMADWLDEIESAISRLHATWSGQAAQEQREYHDRWTKGLSEMREGLKALRGDAQAAHDSYSGVIEHHQSMWPQAV